MKPYWIVLIPLLLMSFFVQGFTSSYNTINGSEIVVELETYYNRTNDGTPALGFLLNVELANIVDASQITQISGTVELYSNITQVRISTLKLSVEESLQFIGDKGFSSNQVEIPENNQIDVYFSFSFVEVFNDRPNQFFHLHLNWSILTLFPLIL